MADILGDRDSNIPDRPTRVAEPSRESQLPKRFYKEAKVGQSETGDWIIELDGRTVKTPGRALLSLPNETMADAVCSEWGLQEERIDPMTMPLTRLLNTAIDGVATDMQAVKEDIVRFAGTDMLCYRAGGPEELVERQRELWDPWIDWAQSVLGCRFELAEGIMHIEQPAQSIAGFSAHVGMIDDTFTLSATHVATTLTGSATLAMALQKGALDADQAWMLAHLDEDWNIEQWGADEEAQQRRATRFKDMNAACFVIANTIHSG